ncbi:DUF4397 domain-containing protein [Cryobacterium sp. 10C3]|uniref:DUF4397 domain-containing protein n=1 Tax=Cryobacterium sp. 10C3 TaxID=3048577 RepID=UPI003A0FF709
MRSTHSRRVKASLTASLTVSLTAASIGALVVFGGLTTATAATGDAQLSVFHGVPGLTVDVYVNNKLTIDNFKPGDMAGPLDLPAGTYTVAITASDAADASKPAIGPVDLPSRRARTTPPSRTSGLTRSPRRPSSPTTRP